uniref:C1q domain-containing protein n=1 Tax=Sinocyclocheilus anshuiensis TaxID=1608454 RepID=A0A671KQ66_9TELE
MQKKKWELEQYLNSSMNSLEDLLARAQNTLRNIRGRLNTLGMAATNVVYQSIFINIGEAYNSSTGVFTVPRYLHGLFSFCLTMYSNKGSEGQRLYQRVALVRQGRSEVAMWEDNREDAEDSATQSVLFSLRAGEQVYAQLMSGREICGDIWGRNIFSGYLLYPTES